MTPSPPPPPTSLSPEDRSDVQGFVTSGFGHLPFAAYLLLALNQPEAARRWLGSVVPDITTAAPWPTKSDGSKVKPTKTLNLAFTAAGLKAIGLSSAAQQSFPSEFLQGMAFDERSRILGDQGASSPSLWHWGGGHQREIHAIALLHANSQATLQEFCQLFLEMGSGFGVEAVAKEFGTRPSDDCEPFGFRDGMGQPKILGIHGEGVKTGEFILGYENEYGFVPVGPVVDDADDPQGQLPPSANPYQTGSRDFGRNGSYLVFRKLEQDVDRFWAFMAEESKRLRGRIHPEAMSWVAAKMMGRWPGGAPLTLAPDRDDPTLGEVDDFMFAHSDAQGHGCPLGAHIRRMNPRDHLPPAESEESLHMTARHRILRHGRPYGLAPTLPSLAERLAQLAQGNHVPEPASSTPVGLHFLCLNASIKRQFEFLQQAWANNPQFGGLSGNPDPIIGSRADDENPMRHQIPHPRLDARTNPLPQFVTVRGGAYFFMPGIRALRYLAGS